MMLASYHVTRHSAGATILSPRGDSYEITGTARAGYRCTCPGFKYRRRCKHVDSICPAPVRHTRDRIDSVLASLALPLNDAAGRRGRWEAAGSWRRGLPDSKDVDVVISCSAAAFESLAADLESAGVSVGMTGETILRGEIDGIPVDIRRAPRGSYGATLLFYTGSARHNVIMRGEAKRRGWKLNEKGLFDADGVRLDDDTEAGIFRLLDLEYREPRER